MSKKIITTDNAPAAIGPYSQAVQAGPFLFVSGQIPLDPETGVLVNGSIQKQTHKVMENVESILAAAGQSMAAITKCTIFMTNLDDFAKVNEIYAGYFKDEPPARATVQVSALPKNVAIEIEAIAYVGDEAA
jgi:2-iminobutanoate/2-iminopropanoate deaminase